MSQFTILVIDDSATIRRLVDSTLTQDGYRVVLAPNAEDGVEKAATVAPDMILLDHQLPGATGHDVCLQLLENPVSVRIPVVISSTLRKKAYAEYTDLANVVDMLPKPYSEELLKTTVANALETGKLIVESQSAGTAVPEVINQVDDAQMTGSFDLFSLREILDLLNNGRKSGVLEIESKSGRVWFYLDQGRVQAALASGISVEAVSATIPESLTSLTPILRMTLGGRSCSELDGMVELLDRKVIDPRLLRLLLRHQAAVLVWHCFSEKITRFRFEADAKAPLMFSKLPLEISLTALLVDAALTNATQEFDTQTSYTRKALRGQNLDRSGLSAQQMQVLSALTEPRNAEQLATRIKLEPAQIARILHAFALADLVEIETVSTKHEVVVMDQSPTAMTAIRQAFAENKELWTPRFVKDALALRILLKRRVPAAAVVPFDSEDALELLPALEEILGAEGAGANVPIVGVNRNESAEATSSLNVVANLKRGYDARELSSAIEKSLELAQESDRELVKASAGGQS